MITLPSYVPEITSQKIIIVSDAVLAAVGLFFSKLLLTGTSILASSGGLILGAGILSATIGVILADAICFYKNYKLQNKPQPAPESISKDLIDQARYEKRNDLRNVTWKDGVSILDQGIYKDYMAEKSTDPFAQETHENVKKIDKNGFTSRSNAIISVPNRIALKIQAAHYAEKYGIHIYACSGNYRDDLSVLLERLNKEISFPSYLGIIYAGGTYLGDEEEFGHVTPLLLYFPGNQKKEQIQCAILDSVQRTQMSKGPLKQFGIVESNISQTTEVRQADGSSCRTGALTLLRNALLHIKKGNFKRGLQDVLRQGQMVENNIIALPPEWDYTEQFTNPLLSDRHVAIRSTFSRKVEKHSETAKQFRDRQKKSRLFNMKFDYFADHKNPYQVPKNTVLDVGEKNGEYHHYVTINVARNVNDYLLEKGDRLKGCLKETKLLNSCE